MWPRRNPLRRILPTLSISCALLFFALRVQAQRPGGGGSPPSSGQRSAAPSSAIVAETPVDLLVSVREPSGMPLAGFAVVNLSSQRGLHLTASTRDDSTARFQGVGVGEYDLEVQAEGYKTASEHASVMPGGTSYTVYVYLHDKNEESAASAAPNGFVMTPKLQGEIDKGLEKMRRQQYDAARTHFEKAAKMAPSNPDIEYLLGMVEYAREHFDEARSDFQKALSVNPSHERSLLAMGELKLRTGDAAGAAETVEKAYLVNGADWRTHWLLAYAYSQQKMYEKALPHARSAAELGKEHGAAARLLEGQILLQLGRREEGRKELETLARSFPDDPSAAEAKSQIAAMDKAVAITPVSEVLPTALPTTPPPPLPATAVRPWAPPDIDSKEYPAAQDVACSESDLVHRTRAKMLRQLGNFERFVATEHIEHQEVDGNGIPGPARQKDFNYLIFVEHPRPGMSFLEESRNGGDGLDSFPTSLATQGLAALALSVFDPQYDGDLRFQCEGLGTWRGQAVWRMRFEQKEDVKSRIRIWTNNRGTYSIPLKGRVWIAASSYDVLHIETDLREPVKELELTRDHLLIDYGPVKFEKSGTTLWLPWDAEMFMELRGKRYHHTHTLRNYMLFSVDSAGMLGKAKEVPE